MSSINTAKIISNGETYTKSDYNGVSIIIRDKDSYVNATKIANDNNKRKSFNTFMKSDKWNDICNNYIKYNLDVKTARPLNKLFYIIKTGTQEIYGTYIHPDLIHFVAEWCNIEYAFKVSIMNRINDIKNITNGNIINNTKIINL